jgi:uncharacterized RDD family membrane protein YckC
MTYSTTPNIGLPDPELDSQFYENVPSRRFLAWVIDGVITFGMTVLACVFTLTLGFWIFPLLWLVVGLIYRTVTIGADSATWGMGMAGIEFRDRNGRKFSSGLGLLHTLIFTAASGTLIVQAISVGLILMTRYQQSLPDMLLGTTAINRPAD